MNTRALPKTFWWHNLTQFGGAMNDNVFKYIMIYALTNWNAATIESGATSSAAILASVGLAFALPFLFIVPIAGNFADKFSKQKMIVGLKVLEFAVMSFGVIALFRQSAPMLYATMVLMASQSAFFGPCKLGIVAEQVDAERLSKANGSIQLFTFLAIISGTLLAPELSLYSNKNFGLAASVCLFIACLGFIASLQIEPTPAHPERKLSLNGFASVFKTLLEIRKDGFLMLAIFALAVFSMAAAFIQLNLLDFGKQHLNLTQEQSTRLFLLTAIGIGVGSTTAGWLSGRNIEFGIVPIGAFLITLSLVTLGTLAEGNVLPAALSMAALGFASGLFIVPLHAFIQYRSPGNKLGAIQATNSFMSWIGILTASGLIWMNGSFFKNTAQDGFLILSLVLLGLALFSLWILPDFFVKFVLMMVTRFFYRFQVHGLDNLPARGSALLVGNHVSLMDAVLIVTSQQRRIRMLMSRNYYDNANWLTQKIVRLAKVILIQDSDNSKKLLQSFKAARTALDEGYLVFIFAEGKLTRTGMMRPFRPGFERIVKGADYPIIPVYIGGAWGSISSYRNGMPKLRPSKDFRYPVSVHYGKPLPSTATTFEVRQAVGELSVESFDVIKERRQSMAHEFIDSARRNWNKLAIAEISGREYTFGELLMSSLILCDRMRDRIRTEEHTIGILLPTGSESAIANIATTLNRRISVNLDHTASPASVESFQKQCNIKTVITARKFLEVLPELPLADNILFVEDLLNHIGNKEKVRAFLKAKLYPVRFFIRGSRIQPDDTATILSSNRFATEPNGVMLSHHNILSNIESFRSVVAPKREDVMLAILPFFNSFGYTVTFWFPLVSGITIVCHTNPLEVETIGELAYRYKASILLANPSLLPVYAREIKSEQLAHLRYVFTGTEKLQSRAAASFEERFSVKPFEGYGATELSSVCAVSLPNVEIDNLEEIGHREGRLGRVLPGMAIKVVNPETAEDLPPGEEGLIYIKGPNVMSGYLNKPELTKSVIHDGWYNTGNMGLMDSDGFFVVTK